VLEDVTGLSKSTIRRIERSDPSFPRSFKLHDAGDRQWALDEVLAWLEHKAGRPLAA
jgi:predicted DNA-binding transcriptional regulator AlpA